jgi:chloride channel protein, CIC family
VRLSISVNNRATIGILEFCAPHQSAWAHGKEIVGFALVIGLSTIAAGLAAWLVRKFAPGAKGSGIPDVEAVLRDEQPPPTLMLIPVKFLGGVLAMGAGLALGREGPTVQMGAGIGHFIATVFRRNQDDVKALLAAGAGAGLATAFSAPVAGAVFVLEELVRRFDTRITITTLCASGSAIAVARLLLGNQPNFQLSEVEELPPVSNHRLRRIWVRTFAVDESDPTRNGLAFVSLQTCKVKCFEQFC